MSDTACINCNRLGACKVVDEEKLRSNYCCDQWEGMRSMEQYMARVHIVQSFGSAGFQALIKPEVREE